MLFSLSQVFARLHPSCHSRRGPVSSSRKPASLLPTPLWYIIPSYCLHCMCHHLIQYLCVHVWIYCLTCASLSPSLSPPHGWSRRNVRDHHRSPLYPQHPEQCLALHKHMAQMNHCWKYFYDEGEVLLHLFVRSLFFTLQSKASVGSQNCGCECRFSLHMTASREDSRRNSAFREVFREYLAWLCTPSSVPHCLSSGATRLDFLLLPRQPWLESVLTWLGLFF